MAICALDRLGMNMVTVSSPNKVMFPEDGITKAALVGYYEAVGAAMLPNASGRPLTLERFPKGVGTKGFMQKNAGSHFPDFVARIPLPKKGGETLHPAVTTVEGIAYLANQGTVTFHATTTRGAGRLPDRLIIDLDPVEGDVASALLAAGAVKDLFDELGIASRPLASGSKGYHVVAPLEEGVDIDAVAVLSRSMAELLAYRHPDLLTTEFRVVNRRGKVFVDWLRNRYTATTVLPWSLRPRPAAPVATCLAWDELADTSPNRWTIRDTEALLARPDPWEGLWDEAFNLEPVARLVQALMDEAGVELAPFDRFRS